MKLLFDPGAWPSVAIAGSAARFPVRRVFCVGRNYAEHAREMGGDPSREPPFFFCKPADAVVDSGAAVSYPPLTQNLQHEVELVVAIGAGGSDIAAEQALDHVYGYAVGNDLTRRDLQHAAKKAGRPWDTAKGFDQSAPLAAIHPAADCGHIDTGEISLAVNGDLRQRADLADMIWSVPEIIGHLSMLFALCPGDLIFTGTPAGVGPLVRGDRVDASIAGLSPLRHTLA